MKYIKNCLLILVFAFVTINCSNSSDEVSNNSDKNKDSSKETNKITTNFVKVEGTTVKGGNKFVYQSGGSADYFKGVFREGRTVTILDFYISDHEVTQAEYEDIMLVNPSYFKTDVANKEVQENRPVEQVSWYDAIVYCNTRSIKEKLTPCYEIDGKSDPSEWGDIPDSNNQKWNLVDCDFNANGYRLPTEIEWEYAALGGKAGVELENPTDYSGTNELDDLKDYAWFRDNSDNKTHEVKKKNPNSLELFDMSGNVMEWCWDWYDVGITATTPVTGFQSGEYRSIRGGCYIYTSVSATVPIRGHSYPHYKCQLDCTGGYGFRLVRTSIN